MGRRQVSAGLDLVGYTQVVLDIAFGAMAHDHRGMWYRFRCLVSMLVAIAFLGAASVQAMPISDAAPPNTAMMAGCADMSMAHDDSAPSPEHGTSHKGMSPDCLKLMQCLGIPSGAVAAVVLETPVAFAFVSYWLSGTPLHGAAIPPTPFPPRQA
jgi:hypothetical protein